MTDDKVIHAFKAPGDVPECPIDVVSSSSVYHCSHQSLEIDTHERTIRCSKCGAVLDPFNYLATNGRAIKLAWQDHDAVRRRVGEMRESIERLAREEKRLKAAVKRAREKLPVQLDVRGKI